MVFLDKIGLQRFWEIILSKFVAKEEGKGLSSNDYTNEEKEKLAGVAVGADVSPIIDATLSQQGQVADAAAVGEAIAAVQDNIAQADWSENDPTNPAYIKNRTHYVQYFYGTLIRADYFRVTEKITNEFAGQLLYDGAVVSSNSIGTTLRLTLFDYSSGETKTCEGNVSLLIESGYVVNFYDENSNIVCSIVQSWTNSGVYENNKIYIYNLDAGTYDILIEGPTEEVIKLNKKFLPDNVVYLSDIEEITNAQIDEICGATIVSGSEVNL